MLNLGFIMNINVFNRSFMMNINMFIHLDVQQWAMPMIGAAIGIAGICNLYENRGEWLNVGRAAIAPTQELLLAGAKGGGIMATALVVVSVYENVKSKAS